MNLDKRSEGNNDVNSDRNNIDLQDHKIGESRTLFSQSRPEIESPE